MKTALKTYRLRFSVMTCRTTVHATACRSAAFYRKPSLRTSNGLPYGTHASGDSLWDVHAVSAKAAAEAQDAEYTREEREMDPVKVCKCCKEPK
jgi:hypothetical protein